MQVGSIDMERDFTGDRRREIRISPVHSIRVHIHLPNEQYEGRLEDINNFGAFVATELDLKSGTRIHLEIELPGELEANSLPAVIVRRRAELCHPNKRLPAGLGMRFMAATREELDHIRQTVLTTLSLDLLGHGLRRGSAPGAEDTVTFDRKTFRPG